jgi:hypothetical protein
MRDAIEHALKDVLISVEVGDCYGDGITLSFCGKERMVVNERIVDGFLIIQDARFSPDGDLRDYGYCVHMPEDQLLAAMKALGYTVTRTDDTGP